MNKAIYLTLGGLLGASAFLSAQTTIVDFSGSGIVSANQGLSGNPTPDYSSAITPGSGYNSQAFYGGVVPTNTTVGSWFISNNVARGGMTTELDWISASVASTSGDETKYHRGVVIFQQSDFLNLSGNPGGVTLDSSTSMSVAGQRSGGSPTRFGFVVQTSATDYYIGAITTYNQFNNNSAFDPSFTNGHYLSIVDPTAQSWFALNTSTLEQGSAASPTPDFTSVIGVGVWFENERASTSTAGLGWHMTGIEITAIPEPHTYALMGGLLALGLVLLRRRK